MSRQRIDYRRLLAEVIPRGPLPDDVRVAVDTALASPTEPACERVARLAIDSLVAVGRLERLDDPDPQRAVERYVDTATGDTITVQWTVATRAERIVRVAIPPDAGRHALDLESVREILDIDQHLFQADGRSPNPYGEIVRAALARVTQLTGADFVTFVPAERLSHPGTPDFGLPETPPERVAPLRRLAPPAERSAVYVPDVAYDDDLVAIAPAADFASVAFAGVGRDATSIDGYLEAWSRSRDFLDADGLTAFALFADRLSATLRKASVLELLVYHDALTGLHNRSYFNQQIAKEVARARRAGQSFALAIADIDDFKGINTRYGYHGGNDVLEQVGRLVRASVRPFDVAARWGGEEFALVLTAPIDEQGAIAVSNRIRESVKATSFAVTDLEQTTHVVPITISVGVSVFPSDASAPEELWATANAALGQAKRRGKNRVVAASSRGEVA